MLHKLQELTPSTDDTTGTDGDLGTDGDVSSHFLSPAVDGLLSMLGMIALFPSLRPWCNDAHADDAAHADAAAHAEDLEE